MIARGSGRIVFSERDGAVAAPVFAPQDLMDEASLALLESFKPPIGMAEADWSYPLGTDAQGRDVLSAILYGMRISLGMGIASVLLAGLAGIGIGRVAGYMGGLIDTLLMRVADWQLTFPAILTALLVDGMIAAALPRGARAAWQIPVPVFAIGISLLPNFARTVRGSTLVKRNKDYVAAARPVQQRELVRIPSASQRLAAHPHQVSGGMRQRVMIALALCAEPARVIADEPITRRMSRGRRRS